MVKNPPNQSFHRYPYSHIPSFQATMCKKEAQTKSALQNAGTNEMQLAQLDWGLMYLEYLGPASRF
jgi:hypothetical protein